MSGNVWEWTRSLSGKPFPPQMTSQFETAVSSNKNDIVLRGGSFVNENPRCSARYRNLPHLFFDASYGFRVVVSPFLTADL